MTHIGGTTRTCAVCLVTHSPIRGPSFHTHSGQRNVLWEMFESPTVETGQTRTSKNILLIPLPQDQLCHAGYSSLPPLHPLRIGLSVLLNFGSLLAFLTMSSFHCSSCIRETCKAPSAGSSFPKEQVSREEASCWGRPEGWRVHGEHLGILFRSPDLVIQ